MSKSMKKFFAFFLALMLVFSMTSVMAFATEDVTPEESSEATDTTGTDDTTADDKADGTNEASADDTTTGTDEAAADDTTTGTDEAATDDTSTGTEESATEEPATEEATTEEPTTEEPNAEEPTEEAASGTSITILHTNDVHCGIDNYAKLAGYRDDLQEAGKNVLLIDAGDHVQGEAIGVLSKGEDIIAIMNGVGYDLAVPGNHEYDYKIPQFSKNVDLANYPYISSNFRNIDGSIFVTDGNKKVESYYIAEVEGKKIAFVGISTPETYTKSTPTYFKDADGNWVYTFSENNSANPTRFIDAIQSAVDEAKAAGADVVVAVGHTGMKSTTEEWNTQTIIAGTNGIDAYIDGHSHEEIPGPDYDGTTFVNKDGKAVSYAQTGTKLANIGEMVINIADDGTVTIKTGLITAEDLTREDEEVKAMIDAAKKKVEDLLGEVVGKSETKLTVNKTVTDEEGNESSVRAVRNTETNMGDFSADAYRIVTGADIALVNGGGVRADINEGDVTRANLIATNPFGNNVIKVKATGQQIMDALEHSVRKYPGENGGFFQVSGLTYDVYSHIPTPVITDEQGAFLGLKEGMSRRVANIMINGEPLDPEKEYTVAGTDYILRDAGDGMTLFKGAEDVSDEVYPQDSYTVLRYMTESLNGVITAAQYGNLAGEGRIVLHDEEEHVFDMENPFKVEILDDKVVYQFICLGADTDEEGNYAVDEEGNYVNCPELETIEVAIPTVTYTDPETGLNEVVRMTASYTDDEKKTVEYSAPAYDKVPTREGYEFKGWETVSTDDSGNTVVRAIWEEVKAEETKPETKPEVKPVETKPAATTTTKATTTKSTSSVPKTGDETSVVLYIMLFAGAMGTGVAAAYRRKNDNAA